MNLYVVHLKLINQLDLNNIYIYIPLPFRGTSQVAQWVKYLPAMQEIQETQIQSLGWEDPLEEGIPTHSSTLAWRIP